METKVNKNNGIKMHLSNLNIPSDVIVTEDIIKESYRYVAKIFHPDKNKSINTNSRMASINNSYEWLLDNLNYVYNYTNGNTSEHKIPPSRSNEDTISLSKYLTEVEMLINGLNSLENIRNKKVQIPITSKILINMIIIDYENIDKDQVDKRIEESLFWIYTHISIFNSKLDTNITSMKSVKLLLKNIYEEYQKIND